MCALYMAYAFSRPKVSKFSTYKFSLYVTPLLRQACIEILMLAVLDDQQSHCRGACIRLASLSKKVFSGNSKSDLSPFFVEMQLSSISPDIIKVVVCISIILFSFSSPLDDMGVMGGVQTATSKVFRFSSHMF